MNTQLMIAGYCPVGNYSFEIIYKKYHTFFVHYAEKTMGEELYAEDVVQDCMLTAFEQLGKLKNPKAFSSWLFTILYHGCMSAIKEQIKQRNTCDIEDYANAFSYNNTVDVEREELKQALNRLSEDDRNIVLLSVVVGLNSKEIAKITGFTAGNVRQRLSRSLSKMKRYLS